MGFPCISRHYQFTITVAFCCYPRGYQSTIQKGAAPSLSVIVERYGPKIDPVHPERWFYCRRAMHLEKLRLLVTNQSVITLARKPNFLLQSLENFPTSTAPGFIWRSVCGCSTVRKSLQLFSGGAVLIYSKSRTFLNVKNKGEVSSVESVKSID